MDINTIFYFPNSLTFEDYSEKLNAGEISARTIVFADAQKAIYKGGKKYGGLSNQEFHDLVDTLYDNSWISDEINGAKSDIIESSARIDELNSSLIAVTGRLNTEITNRESNIAAKVESMFSDAAWLQDNFPQGVTNWDSGWNSDIEAYLQTVGYWTTDDQNQTVTQWSKLSQTINRVEGSVNSLTTNGTLTEALSTTIEGVIDNKVASLNLGTTYASKSSVTSLDGDVDKIEDVLSWMYSGFSSSASEDKSVAQIQAMGKEGFVSAISDIRTQVDKVANGDFVAQTEVASKVGNTISAMLLESSESNGLAALAARMGDVETAESNDATRISAILLGITGSDSTADIQTRIGNVMSGFTSSSDINTAKSEIYSAISAKDSSDNFISLSALKTQADADHSSLTAIASTVSDLQSSSINSAGFVAKTELGSAVAELFASSGNAQNATAKANVVAVVADNKSQLNLTADDVNISGYLSAGSATFKGDIEANSFTTGGIQEAGIGVMAGEFDETQANTHKAYFAYDSAQGGVTMWFYQNGEWKRLDLANTLTDTGNTFVARTFFLIPDETITVMPNSLSYETLYYNRSTGKYYNTEDISDPVTSGTYFWINGDQIKNTPTYYRKNNFPWGDIVKVPQEQIHSSLRSGDLNNLFFKSWPMGGITKFTISNGTPTEAGSCLIKQALTSIQYHQSGTAVPSGIYTPYDETVTLVSNEHGIITYQGDTSNKRYRSTDNGNTYRDPNGNPVIISDGKLYSAYRPVQYSQDSNFFYWTIEPVFTAWDESYGTVNQYAQLAQPNGEVIRLKSTTFHNTSNAMSLSAAMTRNAQPNYSSSGGFSYTTESVMYPVDQYGVSYFARAFKDLTYSNAVTE